MYKAIWAFKERQTESQFLKFSEMQRHQDVKVLSTVDK